MKLISYIICRQKRISNQILSLIHICAGEAAAKQKKKAHFVTCDNYVTMSDGTGIVHIAPAFGEDDSRIGRNYELPFVQFVDGQGNLTKETPYAGVFVKMCIRDRAGSL